MSLLKRKIEPAPPLATMLFKAPAIQERLVAAETKLVDLEHRHQEAALNSLSDVPGSNEALAAIEVEVAEASRTVSTLKKAHSAALEKDEKERRAILAEHHKTIIRVCRSHLAARDAAAAEMSAKLGEAIEQYKIMVSRGAKAKAAVPEWGLARGKQVDPDELYQLVQKEIARLYGHPGSINGDCPFPGGATHDFSMKHQPEKLKPLADALREGSTLIIESLTGKVIE